MTFTPIFDVLPDAQRTLWPALAGIPESFVLYGGTALALRLGHRSSVDFDFFSSESLDADALFELSFVAGAEILQREPETLTVSTTWADRPHPVKLSFFGGIDTGRVGDPEQTDDGVRRVASLLDLFGAKLEVLLQRWPRGTTSISPRSCAPAYCSKRDWAPPRRSTGTVFSRWRR